MRLEKQAIVAEIQRQVEAAGFVLLADYQGLKVEQTHELRRQLRGAGAEFHVVRNRFFKRVAGERDWKRLTDLLAGPSAMVIGSDITTVAKILERFRTDNNNLPVIKAGMLADEYLGAETVVELAQLPGRGELLGRLVGTLAASMSRLADVLHRKTASLVYVLKAIVDKKSAEVKA